MFLERISEFMISSLPLVSVIIPTYKRALYLEKAIESVLNQTYQNVEILVIDDNGLGTKDGLAVADFMQKYGQESRVRYIQHEVNRHGGAARNTGIKSALGEFVTFLDDDDTYRPDKIEKQIQYLINHPEYNAVYCGWDRGKPEVYDLTGDLSYYLLSGDQIILTNAIMINRNDALTFGGFDERLKRHQEAVFLLRYFSTGGQIGAIPEVLVDYDMSDRQNQEKNSREVEALTDYYLEVTSPFIDRVSKSDLNLRKKIFSHRYRGNLFHYLKLKDLNGALSFYFRKGFNYPIYFHASLIRYITSKIKLRISK